MAGRASASRHRAGPGPAPAGGLLRRPAVRYRRAGAGYSHL